MTTSVFRRIGKFFEGAGHAVSTPSGDARGHVRAYPQPRQYADLLGSDAFFDTWRR